VKQLFYVPGTPDLTPARLSASLSNKSCEAIAIVRVCFPFVHTLGCKWSAGHSSCRSRKCQGFGAFQGTQFTAAYNGRSCGLSSCLLVRIGGVGFMNASASPRGSWIVSHGPIGLPERAPAMSRGFPLRMEGRRVCRVVDGSGHENRHTRKGIGRSNSSLPFSFFLHP
jgi:hypothetical protein